MDYDAIVVGARIAGASTAMLLARYGHRVLLIDRATFPSEIAAGHFVHRHGPPRLARWGLLDSIRATGAPAVTSATTYLGDFPLTANNVEQNGVPWAFGPRRAKLDKLLVDAAVASGAHLMEGTSVEELIIEDGQVKGVRLPGGTQIRGTLTIGADGLHSRVARAVNAPKYHEIPTLACWYFSYWCDVPDQRMEINLLPQRRAIFSFPTNDDLYAVFVGFPIEEFATIKTDVEGSVLSALDLAPGLGPRVRAGSRVERFYGHSNVPNFFRKAFGPGWALVGDAGCHKDPFLAMGCCDALRDAELLAGAAHLGLSRATPVDEALQTYEQQRNAATLPDFEENVRQARMQPVPADVLRLRAALRDKPDEATRFFMATHHLIPRESFFNPANLKRILNAAQCYSFGSAQVPAKRETTGAMSFSAAPGMTA